MIIEYSQNRHSVLDFYDEILNLPIVLCLVAYACRYPCLHYLCVLVAKSWKGFMKFFCLGFRNMNTGALETHNSLFWFICILYIFFVIMRTYFGWFSRHLSVLSLCL